MTQKTTTFRKIALNTIEVIHLLRKLNTINGAIATVPKPSINQTIKIFYKLIQGSERGFNFFPTVIGIDDL